MIATLAIFGVAVNLIKDGLTTWVPSILKETYALPDSLSIILTLTLPVLSIFGNSMAIVIHKRIPNFVYHTAVMFGLSGIINKRQIGEMMKILKSYPDTFATFEKTNEVFGNFKRKV